MLKIERFVCNMIRENCYVVSDETGECAIVDCGAWYQEERNALTNYINRESLTPTLLISTHGHLDHNMGNDTPFEAYGLRPVIGRDDEELLNHLPEQALSMFGIKLEGNYPQAERLIDEGDTVNFGNHSFTALATPGHTMGSICLYCPDENLLFSGDTLFHGSIGRTDMKGGSMFLMTSSLRRLAQLPDETQVLPGHGEQTTIGYELAHNPYMDR